jgi:formylglycine-generating enzyme
MALRAESLGRLGAAGIAFGVMLAICHGCDDERDEAPAVVDGSADERTSLIEHDSRAPDGGTEEDACARRLQPTSDCMHPSAMSSCDGGWCRVAHGCFIMGSPPCEFGRGLYDEDQIQVTLTHDYEIQQTEMTQAQWTALGFANPSTQVDGGSNEETYGDCLQPTCPVGNVTLGAAMAAANRLSEQAGLPACYALSGCSGPVGRDFACTSRELTTTTTYECLGYRLPTEAEWEYAARAGTQSAFYDGDVLPVQPDDACELDPVMDRIGWYCFNSGRYSHPVGQKKPNQWGLFDIAGNAAEWTSSDYTGAGLGTSPAMDPMKTLGQDCVIYRGGHANTIAELARSASRPLCVPTDVPVNASTGPLLGLRLVRTLP